MPARFARHACATGFDVHAGVVVSASDREGRERLLRYCARPPLSLERLSVLGDGRIAYAIRKPWGNANPRAPVQRAIPPLHRRRRARAFCAKAHRAICCS